MIKKWKQRQQLAKWLKDHGKNLEEINSLLEQWGKGEQNSIASPAGSCGSSGGGCPTSTTPDVYVPSKPEVGTSFSGSISGVSPTTGGERLPHCDMDTWYLRDVGRDGAEEMLMGKPQGTFLIRPSSDGQHALSIMCAGRVGHCKIYQVLLAKEDTAWRVLTTVINYTVKLGVKNKTGQAKFVIYNV